MKIYQNLRDAVKAELRGKFTAYCQMFILGKRKVLKSMIQFLPQGNWKKEQIKPKTSRRKNIRKVKAEINKSENTKINTENQ